MPSCVLASLHSGRDRPITQFRFPTCCRLIRSHHPQPPFRRSTSCRVFAANAAFPPRRPSRRFCVRHGLCTSFHDDCRISTFPLSKLRLSYVGPFIMKMNRKASATGDDLHHKNVKAVTGLAAGVHVPSIRVYL
jgi:hypothetical protein